MKLNQIKKEVSRIQKLLHLEEWIIYVELQDNLPDNALGSCNYNLESLSALILLDKHVCDEEIVKVIKHEMLHIIMAKFTDIAKIIIKNNNAYNLINDILILEEEQIVTKLSAVI